MKCVYIQTGWPETRYLHAEKVSSSVSDLKFADDPSVFEIDGRIGLYKESTTLLHKYERRGTVDKFDKPCYAKFCNEYDPNRKEKKETNQGMRMILLPRYGPMFGCISCHTANYIRNVDVFDDTLQRKLKDNHSVPGYFLALLKEAYYNINVEAVQQNVYLGVGKDGSEK